MLNNENALDLVTKINSTTISDEEKENAWCVLVEHCKERFEIIVRSRGWTFSKDWDKEDFFQEVCLKMYVDLPKYDANRSNIATWFNLLCYITYLKHHEVRKRKEGNMVSVSPVLYNENGEEASIIDLYHSTKSIEDMVLHNQSWEMVYEAINSLKENYRDVVMLCDVMNRKPHEAAVILGCKPADVSRWLNRAHKKLSAYAKEMGVGEELFTKNTR